MDNASPNKSTLSGWSPRGASSSVAVTSGAVALLNDRCNELASLTKALESHVSELKMVSSASNLHGNVDVEGLLMLVEYQAMCKDALEADLSTSRGESATRAALTRASKKFEDTYEGAKIVDGRVIFSE